MTKDVEVSLNNNEFKKIGVFYCVIYRKTGPTYTDSPYHLTYLRILPFSVGGGNNI